MLLAGIIVIIITVSVSITILFSNNLTTVNTPTTISEKLNSTGRHLSIELKESVSVSEKH